MSHGTILGGVVTVPGLGAALADYRDVLGLDCLEIAPLDAAVAASWGCPGNAGSPSATLRPRSGSDCFIRLVEQPAHPAFVPTTSYGWAAYELTVEDVFGWPDRLAGSGFEVIGPPKSIPGMDAFVPMQVLGPGREMVYLNEVRGDMAATDLPRAASLTDRIFIIVLATPDRSASVAWYRDRLRLDECDSFTIPYTMINKAFGLPEGTLTTLTMMQKGRMPIVEIDDYPAAATVRPRHAGLLPPGNALVTLGVDSLDALALDWIAPPAVREGALYAGRRAATVMGPASELLELVELG